MKVGLGYDVHRLAEGEELILGGVEIDHSLGLVGHSDADVLLHAIKDALLGAIGAGDIGSHFPDDDPQYRGISSLLLLDQVMDSVLEAGFEVNNLDTVIIAQQPKLAPYLPEMKNKIAQRLQVEVEQVNLKATTTERLGFIGQGEGIAAQAIVSINER
ncbi:2-C-methyl-D-erythritol 2,4-cyclodiphosphate synthase [Natroniella sulfidigena]|uniref:2-C-methyl-D-erythritol 2,4-cyclodiphosphate synthase n=1 Tax=Natroniella sulfidigena TaxID=723921 RepID=UPI00200B12C7|nr:2-C-methyl-D-erythritol 2,4-cyclodiphosphate synthase [Natroniella sulfidigena]MCK8816233.1 2-C-methyl-D-erythritol 2,4-cyclodiphosphate synthase [Natroniella sulfidigena]